MKEDVKDNYGRRAEENQNQMQRQQQRTFQLKAFNNWVKSVLINTSTKQMCRILQSIYDLRKGQNDQILHVLDVGCGRGQDIKKWQISRVKYLVATDFSEECLKAFEDRWRERQRFRLYTAPADFTKTQLYYKVQHSYYDLVSAQFCFHYMFDKRQSVETGIASMLSNLLINGLFISTIPDTYSILRKIKEKGKQVNGHYIYGNDYFSMKFQRLNFTQPFGNQYGFYLQGAVGEKDGDGNIHYINEYLVPLDELQEILKLNGAQIEQTMNFLEFYKKYRDEYKDLFYRFRLRYNEGQMMDADLWQICHLYRVLICRKVGKGKTIKQFNPTERFKAIKAKEIKRRSQNIIKPNNRNRFNDKSHDRRGHKHHEHRPRYEEKRRHYQ